jgi:hypothetical protein
MLLYGSLRSSELNMERKSKTWRSIILRRFGSFQTNKKKDLERLLLKIEQIFPYKIQMLIFDP